MFTVTSGGSPFVPAAQPTKTPLPIGSQPQQATPPLRPSPTQPQAPLVPIAGSHIAPMNPFMWSPERSFILIIPDSLIGEDKDTSKFPGYLHLYVPRQMAMTYLYPYDNTPLEEPLLSDAVMLKLLDESNACLRIGGIQDDITTVALVRFFKVACGVKVIGAVCRSRGMWCVAVEDVVKDTKQLASFHENFWFTPIGVIQASDLRVSVEVQSILQCSRTDNTWRSYPRHLMTVRHWTPNQPRSSPWDAPPPFPWAGSNGVAQSA